MSSVNEHLREAVENTIGVLAQIFPAAYEDLYIVENTDSEEELESIAVEYGVDPSKFQGFGR